MAETDDPVEAQMLDRLARRARGEKDIYNPWEVAATPAEQQEAMKQFIAIRQAQEARKAREFEAMRAQAEMVKAQAEAEKMRADAVVDTERMRLDNEKHLGQMRLEEERLRLDAERVKVQQAEMVLKAMEMAAKNPELGGLLQLAEGLAQEVVATRRLTVKGD